MVLDPSERADVVEISNIFGYFFVNRLNILKKAEIDLKYENEYLRDKISKLELALSNSFDINNLDNKNKDHESKTENTTGNYINFKNINTKSNGLNTRNSKTGFINFKASDPISKMLTLINKLTVICDETNQLNIDLKDEKYTITKKFKRKIFKNKEENWNSNLAKSELNKLINMSQEAINFESDDKFEAFNYTGMRPDYLKTKITYEKLYHYIEELLISYNYYNNNSNNNNNNN